MVDRSAKPNFRVEPEGSRRFGAEAEHLGANTAVGVGLRLEREDRRADLADRVVELRDRVADASSELSVLGERERCLKGQPRREEPLDDRVVEVAGDALPVRRRGELRHAFVETGVGDRDAGRRGERDDE